MAILRAVCMDVPTPYIARSALTSGASSSRAGFSVAFIFSARWGIVLLCLLLFAAITASLLALPIKHTPERFQVCFKHLSFNAVMRCCLSRIWAVTGFEWCHVAHEPWHVGPACSARERAFASQLSWLKGVHGSCFRASGPLLPAHAGMWHRLHNTADSLPGKWRCSQRNRR